MRDATFYGCKFYPKYTILGISEISAAFSVAMKLVF